MKTSHLALESLESILPTPPRILVIDDDPLFCRMIAKAGRKRGILVQTCDSLTQLTALGKMSFDVALIDYYFGDLTGVQLSFLVGHEIPVLLTSATERCKIPEGEWPNTVREFIHKSRGVDKILNETLKLAGVNTLFRNASVATSPFGPVSNLPPTVGLWIFISATVATFLVGLLLFAKLQTSPHYFWDQLPVSTPTKISSNLYKLERV